MKLNLDKLLGDVKNDIDITWSDVSTDKKVLEDIKTGIRKFDRLSATENDYTEEGSACRYLLFNYCRYAWNNCIPDFDSNYKKDIMDFVIDHEVSKENEKKL